MGNIKVLSLTKYDNRGASSRLRSIQYFKELGLNGIEIIHSPLFDDNYLDVIYNGNKTPKLYILKRYFKRLIQLFSAKKYDLLWIEKELFPWLPLNIEKWLSKLGIKYIVDYDDAIFHNYDQHKLAIIRYFLGNKIPNVMRNASLVTVCNSYLKQKAIDSNAKKIEIIPTVVDLERYNDMCEINNTKLTIGWIGTPKTEKYIIELKSVFETISKEIDLKIVVIGGKEFSSDIFEYEIVPWSEDKEVEYINKLDIGIMPLSDSKWEKGKCGYKLIQYMACGKPVIASAIGMNCDIVENNKNGFLVNNNTEWINAIKNLKDSKIRKEMGYYGKNLVEKNYSLQATINKKISHILGNI